MPLDLPDVVGEVFKWLDGFYLTPILVKKSWRELARKSIPIYLEAEFGNFHYLIGKIVFRCVFT
jgi:hypothetical protein